MYNKEKKGTLFYCKGAYIKVAAKKNIGFLIKQINNNYEREFNKALKKTGLTVSQCEVLDYLFHCRNREVCVKDVQKALKFKQPTVTGILARMEEKHFLELKESGTDKRRKNIILKEEAFEVRRKMERERRKVEQQLLEGMSEEEKEQVYDLLKHIFSNVEG